jgi:drug/metabolite transporter (DMT)-like permease
MCPSNVTRCVRVGAAFAAIYLIWGSTYLAIRLAIQSVPPFLMAGVRFCIAGALLYLWTRRRGAPPPSRYQWREAAVVGILLLSIGNGGVSWAEQRIPSGLVALMVAMVPLWMVILESLRPGGTRPGGKVIAGLGLGLTGMVVLVAPGSHGGGPAVDFTAVLVLVLATLGWSIGSLYTRRARLPDMPLRGTAMEMLVGGALLVSVSGFGGEWGQLDPGALSVRSLLAMGYLIVFGSLVGFSAYMWLLRTSTPARVSTYAFVNPVVAIFLGWSLASEPLTWSTLLAAAIIIGGVGLITTSRPRSRPAATTRSPG